MDVSLTRGRKGAVRPAGVKNYGADESASSALDFSGRPPTPERLKRFRVVAEPGTRVRAAGPMRDDPVDTDRFYGAFADRDDGARAALDNSKTAMEEYAEVSSAPPRPLSASFCRAAPATGERLAISPPQAKAEAVYRTARREQLGTSFRYQDHPERTKRADFVYGKPSVASSATVKELSCPVDHPEYEEREAVYRKSHGAYRPGEQRTRMLDWSTACADPKDTRFGVVPARPEKDGVGKALDAARDPEATTSRVVPLRVEAARMFGTDQVGKARPLGLAPYARPPPERFGRPSSTKETWGAAECLRGDYTEEEMMPDSDLGRATRPGFRNAAADPDRVFGIPSLRTDVAPRQVSVAEPQNFGQDAPLKDLVNPSRFMTMGIDHSDFARQRERDELRDLFASIGHDLDAATFDAVYHRAATVYDVTDVGSVSVEEFKRALGDYLGALEDEGAEPAWCREHKAATA